MSKPENNLVFLLNEDVQWVLSKLPSELRQALIDATGAGVVAFVCGGFIRACIAGEPINDIDIITNSKPNAHFLTSKIQNAMGIDSTYETDNATTLRQTGGKPPIQIIHRWTSQTVEELLQSFDFTIAKAAVWYVSGKGWCGKCDPRFYPDLAAKRLVYTMPQRNEDAGGSILRVLKFYQRGYRIPIESMGAVVARLVGAVKTASIHKNDDSTMDEGNLSRVLTGLLVEVDPSFQPANAKLSPEQVGESMAEGITDANEDDRINAEGVE